MYARVTQIAVAAVPPVVGIFAILVSSTSIVGQGTLPEESPQLVEYRLVCIPDTRWWVCMLYPLIFMPNRVRTVCRKNRYHRLSCFVAGAFVQVPMLPKGTQVHQSVGWVEVCHSFYV